VSKVFGISTTCFTEESWKEEDNAEYPFSVGTYHPKRSSDEAAATPVWDALESSGAEANEDEWNSDEEENDVSPNSNAAEKQVVPQTNGGESLHKNFEQARRRNSAGLSALSFRGISDLSKVTSPTEGTDGATTLSGSTCPPPMDLIIPDQNVKAKSAKKKGNMQQDIEKLHLKVSRATLYFFEDRVFSTEDKDEAQKCLSLYKSKNPIRRKIDPLLGSVMKIFETQLSFVRAVFNICMWTDPMLSFWFTLFVFGLMVVLFIFPWRLFFFVVGVLGLGPQNYFLYDLYLLKRSSKSKTTPTTKDPSRKQRNSMEASDAAEDLSTSPLLFRDNAWMKPDGKLRNLIIPGADCVFRFNRFYDWPPEPATPKGGKEM